MKKTILGLCIAVALIAGFAHIAFADEPTNEIRVILDGETLEFDVQPMIHNNRTLVPLRAIFEAMGAMVEWDEITQTVTATKEADPSSAQPLRDGNEAIVVVLTIGSTSPTVAGQVVAIDQPGIIVNNRTLAPVRFVAEAFGGTVNWDEINRIVAIESGDSPAHRTDANNNDSAKWLFFSDESRGLFGMDIESERFEHINDDWAIDIVTSGDWIYYSKISEEIDTTRDYYPKYTRYHGVHRARLDGSGESMRVTEFEGFRLVNVADDLVYYVVENNASAVLYATRADGNGAELIIANHSIEELDEDVLYGFRSYITDFAWDGDYVYCGLQSGYQPLPYVREGYEYAIFRTRIDGGGTELVASVGSSEGFRRLDLVCISSGWLYFQFPDDDYVNEVFKIRVDGTELTKIHDIQKPEIGTSFDGESLFYLSGNEIYRYELDGSVLSQIVADGRDIWYGTDYIVDGWIYYRLDGENYRIRVDGTDAQLLSSFDKILRTT